MPTAEEVRARVEAYVDAFTTKDKAAFLELFAPDAVWHDPVGAPPYEGREAIASFWDTVHSLANKLVLEPRDIVACGDEAAMVFTLAATTGDDTTFFDVIDTFVFDGDGKISQIKAYWDMTRGRVG